MTQTELTLVKVAQQVAKNNLLIQVVQQLADTNALLVELAGQAQSQHQPHPDEHDGGRSAAVK